VLGPSEFLDHAAAGARDIREEMEQDDARVCRK